MDQCPEMKGFYIVMGNAPIHTNDDIDEMISKRGYKAFTFFHIHLSQIQSRTFGLQ
jgi:hypothetical protein